MIVFTVLGTSHDSTEEQLQEITRRLIKVCKETHREMAYVAFPVDRMLMDLGTEILVQVTGDFRRTGQFFDQVKDIFAAHFPPGTIIGIQSIGAQNVRSLVTG